MTRIIFSLLAALALFACNKPAQTSATPPSQVESGAPILDPAKGAVLPEAKAGALIQQCSRGAPVAVDGVWTPTATEIAELELGLGKLLHDELAKKADSANAQAADYYRQYGGLILKGARTIYVNGFHKNIIEGPSPAPMDWRTEPVMVCDGGTGFFGVEYDVESGGLTNFAFNGPG